MSKRLSWTRDAAGSSSLSGPGHQRQDDGCEQKTEQRRDERHTAIENQIVEASDANNLLARTANRPCPDMAIDSIKKRSNDLKTEFVPEIRLVNKGNAHARFRYLALTLNSSSFGPLPSADFDKLMELAPGQGKTFTIGNAFGYQKMYVRVFVDRFNEVAELDESNNFKEKTLD